MMMMMMHVMMMMSIPVQKTDPKASMHKTSQVMRSAAEAVQSPFNCATYPKCKIQNPKS